LSDVAGHFGDPLVRNAEDDNPVRLVNLRSGDARAAGILHRLDHILDEPAYPRRCRVINRLGSRTQNRVPHAGNLQ